MTKPQLESALSLVHTALGFTVDEDMGSLYALMRYGTPRRVTRAIASVADDTSLLSAADRYNRLLEILREPGKIPVR